MSFHIHLEGTCVCGTLGAWESETPTKLDAYQAVMGAQTPCKSCGQNVGHVTYKITETEEGEKNAINGH